MPHAGKASSKAKRGPASARPQNSSDTVPSPRTATAGKQAAGKVGQAGVRILGSSPRRGRGGVNRIGGNPNPNVSGPVFPKRGKGK